MAPAETMFNLVENDFADPFYGCMGGIHAQRLGRGSNFDVQEHLEQMAACTPYKVMAIVDDNVHRISRRQLPWPFQGT